MRKAIAVGFLTILFVCSSMAQTRKSDWEHEGLKGSVHIIVYEEAKLEMKGGKQEEKKRVMTLEMQYDIKGELLEKRVRTQSDGRIIRAVYSYARNGDRIQTWHLPNIGPNPPFIITKSGQVLDTGGKMRDVCKFIYDAQGNRIEEITETMDGDLFRSVYKHDASGNITEKLRYQEKRLLYRTVFTRDASGNVTEEINYNPGGSISSKKFYSYEFDKAGNWIKRIASKQGKKAGQLQPIEVTYRTITYYEDEEK